MSNTTFNLADACSECGSASSGSWSVTGPTQFSGTVSVFGDNPIMTVTMGISGTGYFDLSHTATLTMNLPPGVSFTSSSGVFLTAEPPPPPEPPPLEGITTIINSLLLGEE